MSVTLKFIAKHILLPIVYGIGIGIFLELLFEPKDFFSLKALFTQILYCCILTLLFWKGNESIILYLKNRFSWIKDTRKLIVLNFSLTFTYSLTVILLFYLYVWNFLMHKTGLNGFFDHFKVSFYICLSITAISVLIAYIYHFFQHFKQSVIDGERLKREAVVLEYESLKNQVNPHFLFNSLNALTSLIEKSPDDAIKYVKQLSNVYRYVLDQNIRETVSVNLELKFIEAYIYLQKIRFEDKLLVEINISDLNFSVVPMTLQILLENALKHNEISDIKNLKIVIFDNVDKIIVENNIQPKDFLGESNQIGLKTLKFQYEYLTGKAMEIIHDESIFRVIIPKIKETN